MEGCLGNGYPMAKYGADKSGSGAFLVGDRASKARRGVAIINYMAQGRPDMVLTARVLSHRMTASIEGTDICLNGGIRCLASHMRRVFMFSRGLEA